MASPQTLIELLLSLLKDPEAAEAFKADPAAYIQGCGLTGFTAEDVHDAALLIQDNDDSDFERNHDTGGNHHHTPPPPPHKEPHESDHEHAVKYLNTYVTNNWVDDRDTIVDNSINQVIDTDGGDFRQDIDIDAVTASGDGAVAAGGDIEDSTITTGNGNVVGDGNQVVDGDGNTTAFGNGSATSTNVGGDLTVDDGSAFATGGNAGVDNSDNSINDSGNEYTDNSINDSGNDHSDNSVSDSGNFDQDVDNSSTDSFNSTTDNSTNDSHNVGVTTDDVSVEDSFVTA
ncbi:IniB N-terminal domain-containing protein [Pseudonocardia sp. RS11V-5]|uniref:IniB N-terminal domain-containing protein n=1 Tax=Pseudonocardia terrae TaxID=2905831 RepID=UPI001E327936|nr:IniB N-terminal domain-containing protein [Pseudonocardia terrae]MCE3555188.1 IniB N-terminal domain-containing protein [Pseudonocardia terrae]